MELVDDGNEITRRLGEAIKLADGESVAAPEVP
jgi:hypothetical protein